MASIPAGGVHGASHEVLGRLAVGGMAELYLARTTHDDGRHEIVVLKRILPHLAEDPEFVRMFRDEAFLAATLDHPHIVRVHDIGQDGEDYFFTMEYVHGENVRTIIKAAQKIEVTLPLEHVVQIAMGVCEGLHYAHEQLDEDGTPLKIVHRDVSPTNILVAFDGKVKIVDFGIAKAAAATHVTQAGMLKGKASYMSPEQCRAQPVDRRSDVFAIGILIYEMTTLTRLFRGDNELAVLHQILTGTVEAPSTRVDDYSAPLERIVLKALSQKPEDRYPTAAAMGEDLRAFAKEQGLSPNPEDLGEYLRDLCGEKPHPWSEEEPDEAIGLDVADESGTGTGATSMGNFEDEEDTQVNRRAPDLRTLIPGAPSGWTPPVGAVEPATPDDDGEDPTGPTDRRPLLGGGPVPPAQAPPTPRPAARTPRVPPAPRIGGRAGQAIKPLPRPTPAAGVDSGLEHATTPMKKPAAARRPLPRPLPASARTGETQMPSSANRPAPPRPFTPRSGRTLPGAGGGLASPLPARSGRTVPGNARAASVTAPAGQSPLPPGVKKVVGGSADQTMAVGAGSMPVPRPAMPRPGSGATGASPPGPNPPAPSPEPERTMPLSAAQMRAAAMAGRAGQPPRQAAPTPAAPTPVAEQRSNSWSLPPAGQPPAGGARPQLSVPALVAEDVDEGARTVALPRFSRTMLAEASGGSVPETPKGPMGWSTGGNEDPLTQTQRSPVSSPSADGGGQRVSPNPPSGAHPPMSLTATQRTPSAAYPSVASPAGLAAHEEASARGIQRPQMRSPAPRPQGTPRSLWVPILLVVIVALAVTAAWLWWNATGAATSTRTSAHHPTRVTRPSIEPTAPPSDPSLAAIVPADGGLAEPGSNAAGSTGAAAGVEPASSGDEPEPATPSDDGTDVPMEATTGATPTGDTGATDAGVDDAGGDAGADDAGTQTTTPHHRRRRRRQPNNGHDPGSPGTELPGIRPGRPVPP